ncbi:TatD family hydrolase [Spiribacter vilamensis]|uniref:TatD DNase family protein n=1 Tax=Spiribacter vilamensis TaxID=531306 RepID=A0A4V2GJ55_9GAMM|nr:TatD family hydrolase [Spiribacter vilamensis]RZU98535.1 TatD DNase family protein [Spiribacter vilamensis]TVO60604.1 TatD family deoxyribonuclease [Spiribacter vilamensis]
MIIDSHCHFHLLERPESADNALAEARAAGVDAFLNVAVGVEERDRLIAFSERHDDVFTSVGVHPCGDGEDPEADALAAMADHPRVVAIGETGLDYGDAAGDYGWQRDRFRRHIEAARQSQRPIIVHSRMAPDDTLAILRESRADEVGGVIHCFVEDATIARGMLDLGFYLSLSGILTFRRAEALRETVRGLPMNRLLVETDSPYLAPVPHRGEENRPGWVREVIDCLADLQGLSADAVAEQTAENFYACFPRATPSAAG